MSLVNLTNYHDHPTNIAYVVFFFNTKEVADTFEDLLLINAVDFERDQEDGGMERHLFGIRKNEFELAERLNYDALGKHRKRFIPNWYLRMVILMFTLIVVALAVIGAIRAAL